MNKLYQPFSTAGSYWAVHINKDNSLAIRDIRGGDANWGELFRIEFDEGYCPVYRTSETLMTLYHEKGLLGHLVFVDEDTLRIQWFAPSFRLRFFAGRYDHVTFLENGVEATHYEKQIKVALISPQGTFTVPSKTCIQINGEVPLELTLESYKVVPKSKRHALLPFDAQVRKSRETYEAFVKRLRTDNHDPLTEACLFALWRNLVKAEGHLNYTTLYMSKNDMNNVWSWDHYFSALGLAHLEPQLAYEQLLVFEQVQDDSGAFPDYMNDQFASYNCIKPPLLGWTYLQLMARDDYFKDSARLRRIIKMCEKQLDFYETYRKGEKGGYYYKHGNDSGWDNASLFESGQAVLSPDLLAYLITTYDFLIQAYHFEGKANQVKMAENGKNKLLKQLITLFWDDDSKRFFARDYKTFEKINSGDSLLLYMPMILGHNLPMAVLKPLIEGLKTFECPYGLATEQPNSSFYKYNGYWLGPVWAPTMHLMTSALETLDPEWANTLRNKFINAVNSSGFAENFDPFTGEGLVDYGFAWTASVTLDFIQKRKTNNGGVR